MTDDRRVAIVTGAARGLGRAHVLRLVEDDVRVAILDLDGEPLAETRRLAEQAGGDVLDLVADVASRDAVERAVSAAEARFGRIDAVVSNAGTVHAATGIADTDDDDWDRTLAVHLGGARNLVRAALPALRRSDTARIVLTSSLWAQRGPGFGHAYAAVKGAIVALARNLAVELGPAGICVNAIAPGSVPTRMAEDYGPDEIADDCRSIPLGRWAEAREMADVVAFLASPRSSYVTGQLIAVNGGQVFGGA